MDVPYGISFISPIDANISVTHYSLKLRGPFHTTDLYRRRPARKSRYGLAACASRHDARRVLYSNRTTPGTGAKSEEEIQRNRTRHPGNGLASEEEGLDTDDIMNSDSIGLDSAAEFT